MCIIFRRTSFATESPSEVSGASYASSTAVPPLDETLQLSSAIGRCGFERGGVDARYGLDAEAASRDARNNALCCRVLVFFPFRFVGIAKDCKLCTGWQLRAVDNGNEIKGLSQPRLRRDSSVSFVFNVEGSMNPRRRTQRTRRAHTHEGTGTKAVVETYRLHVIVH